jgi:hypothetical protein
MTRLDDPVVVYTFKRRFKGVPSDTNPCIKREEFHYEELIPKKKNTITTNKVMFLNGGSERYDSWYHHYINTNNG